MNSTQNKLTLEDIKDIIFQNSNYKKHFFKKIDVEKKKINILNEQLKKNIERYISKFKNNEKENIKKKIEDILININNNINEHQKIYLKKILLQKLTNYKIYFSNYDKELIKFYKDIFLKKKFFYRNSLKLTYFNENDKIYIPELESYDTDNVFIAFGLNKLDRYHKVYINQIFFYLLNYLLPLNKKFIDIDYIKNDIYLLNISRILLKNKLNNNLLDKSDKKYIGKGAWGFVYSKNEDIYKYEDLRFVMKTNKKEGRIPYQIYNYVASTILINFIIQNYLYYLNHKYIDNLNNIYYIPNIKNIFFGYQNNISLTIMSKAFNENKNYEFINFVRENLHRESFINDFLLILKELCKILIFFQDKCCFVHYDLHMGNLLIDYKYNNNILEYKLKIIDFGLSSIVININGENKLLKYINMRQYKNPNAFNPLKSTMWYKYDLIKFIGSYFFKYEDLYEKEEYLHTNNYQYENNNINNNTNNNTNNNINNNINTTSIQEKKYKNYLKLSNKLCKIFHIDKNFRKNYEIYLKKLQHKLPTEIHGVIFHLMQNSDARDIIYGKKLKLNYFDPRELLQKLND